MSSTSIHLDAHLNEHVRSVAIARENDALSRLREHTADHPYAIMQISPEQGRLMALLVKALGATRAIEIGVFTGYSALAVAEALPSGGKLVACDINEEYTAVAQSFWEEAGVADRIDLRIGPASETLAQLIEEGEEGSYGFAFVDADKQGYDGYYEQCLTLVERGGMIAFDNMFMAGRVVDPAPNDVASRAIAALTNKITADERVDAALVPIGDGLKLVRKR